MSPAVTLNCMAGRSLRCLGHLALLSCLGLALSLPVFAQTNTSATDQLPPAAQQSIAKGLVAAKQRQWLAAIRAFEEARAAAPGSPIPLYNLGLAEAQMPGRELRAICWFEAYLALAPNADNAAAVRQEIVSLDARAADNVRKLLELLKKSDPAASNVHASLEASLLVRINDLNGALAASEKSSGVYRDINLESIVKFLAESGNHSEALRQAEKIKSKSAYRDIAAAQIEQALYSEAKDTLSKLASLESDRSEYFLTLFRLAQAEYTAGQRDDANTLMREADAAINVLVARAVVVRGKNTSTAGFLEREVKGYSIDYAVAQYKMGEIKEGETALHDIIGSLGELKVPKPDGTVKLGGDYSDRASLLCSLAIAQYKIGQREVALQLLKEAEDTANAARKANEIFAVGILNGTYLSMQDWDGVRALALRQTKSGLQRTKEERADWLAYNEKTIVDQKQNFANFAAKSSLIKALTDTASSPAQRALAWSDYLKATMSAPIFTDFKGTLDGFSTYVPKKSVFMNTSVFAKVQEQAELILSRLGDIHVLQAKQATP
jgi:hypothetical protein